MFFVESSPRFHERHHVWNLNTAIIDPSGDSCYFYSRLVRYPRLQVLLPKTPELVDVFVSNEASAYLMRVVFRGALSGNIHRGRLPHIQSARLLRGEFGTCHVKDSFGQRPVSGLSKQQQHRLCHLRAASYGCETGSRMKPISRGSNLIDHYRMRRLSPPGNEKLLINLSAFLIDASE